MRKIADYWHCANVLLRSGRLQKEALLITCRNNNNRIIEKILRISKCDKKISLGNAWNEKWNER
jgi:hypothetical protein